MTAGEVGERPEILDVRVADVRPFDITDEASRVRTVTTYLDVERSVYVVLEVGRCVVVDAGDGLRVPEWGPMKAISYSNPNELVRVVRGVPL